MTREEAPPGPPLGSTAPVGVDSVPTGAAVTALDAHRDLHLLPGSQARRHAERHRGVLVHGLHIGEELLAIGGGHLLVRAGAVLDGLIVLVLFDLAGREGLGLVSELVPREGRVATRAGGREVRDVAYRSARVTEDDVPDHRPEQGDHADDAD